MPAFLLLTSLLSLFAATVVAETCQTAAHDPVPNMCSSLASTPFCVNTAAQGATPAYQCKQCGNNCDCPIGQYCVKQPGPSVGTCVDLETTILGRPCNPFWVRVGLLGSEPEQVVPVKDVNDRLVCGIPVFHANNSFWYYEWLGHCDMGVCKQCANLGGEVDEFFGYMMNPQTLQCPGRECRDAEIVLTPYAQPWTIVDEIMPKGVPGAILVFVVFIFIVVFIRCINDCRGAKRLRNGAYNVLRDVRTDLDNPEDEFVVAPGGVSSSEKTK